MKRNIILALGLSPLWIFMFFLLLNFLLSFGFSLTSVVVTIGVVSYLGSITMLIIDAER